MLVCVVFMLTSVVLVNKREKYHHQSQTMGSISQMAATHANTVYIWSANCPLYLYHETETGFRIESETGLYKSIR